MPAFRSSPRDMPDLIDIGINLTHDSYDADRETVIEQAAAAGVTRLIVTGTTVEASRQAAALADQHAGRLFATAGVHPHHAKDLDDTGVEALRVLLAHPRVVAAGECGLDHYRDFSPRDAQQRCFEAQLELAAETGKPVFLHQRDAHETMLGILREARDRLSGGVAHCFTGGPDEVRDYLDLDLYIGITGWVCDERRGNALRAALPEIPLERLLLETDAPYLLPRDLRPVPHGRRNEPRFLPHVLRRVAEGMRQPVEAVAAHSTRNAERLFGLPSGEGSPNSPAAH
jgi:TatD DNase family protein